MSQTKFTRRDAMAVAGAGLAAAASVGAAPVLAQAAGAQSALVTGCSSGFGNLGAIELARAGFQTFATMRDPEGSNAEAAQALTDLAASEGLLLEVLPLDVRDSASVDAAVATAETAAPLSVVANNAGYILAGPIELHSEEDVRAQFDTNIFGYHRLIRAVLPGMRARGSGLVIQVSSGLGRIVFPTQGWYVSTKFAIEGMSEALAYEMAPFGVEVSIVQPTQYATQFLPNGRRYFDDLLGRVDDERRAAYEQQIGMTQFGLQDGDGADAAEVATAIRELAMMETGTRPLRRVVSPDPAGLQQINAGLGAAQDGVFAGSPFEPWRAATQD